jgi:L-fuconolactonase
MIVDGHVHLFRSVSAQYPRAISELFPPERAALSADFLDIMNAHGIDRAVVVSLSEQDRYLRESVGEHPERFSGISVDRGEGPENFEDLERELRWPGCGGLRMSHLGNPDDRTPRQLSRFPLLRYLADNRLKLWFYSTAAQLSLLDGIASELGSLKIVLNHLGFCPDRIEFRDGLARADVELPPATLGMVTHLARHPNVYIMVSGEYCFSKQSYPFADLAPIVREVYDCFGPARLMWASDYPWTVKRPGYRKLMDLPALHLPDIPGTDMAMIMGGTAAALFDLDGTDRSTLDAR